MTNLISDLAKIAFVFAIFTMFGFVIGGDLNRHNIPVETPVRVSSLICKSYWIFQYQQETKGEKVPTNMDDLCTGIIISKLTVEGVNK